MKRILLCFTLILSMICLSACSSKETDLLANIQNKGYLTIGTSADYAPYEFHKIIDGKDEIVGFEMEIAKKIAEYLGVELKIVDMSFEGLLNALNSSQVDMVIAAMTPTAERAEVVDFSDTYYQAKQCVVIRSEDLDKYNSIEDFVDVKVGVQRNSLQEQIFNEQFTGASLVSLTKIPNIILELQNSTIDACIMEYPVARGYIEQYPELTVANIEIPISEDGNAIVLRKGNEELLNQINEIIRTLIDDGSIDEFVAEAILMTETE